MRKLLLLSTAITLLISCATLPSKNIPADFDKNSNEGMVIGTMAFKNEKPIFNGYFYYYTTSEGKKVSRRNWININPQQIVKMKFKPNFYDGDKAVYFYSISLPPGDYKFVSLGIFENGGTIQYNQSIPMKIDFNVEQGKIKYLGEIYLDYRNKIITLNDQKNRDLPKLNFEFPNLKID